MMKKNFLFPIILLLSVHRICSQGGTTLTDSLYISNQYRTYRLYIPPTYNPAVPSPLVINLHGYGSSSYEQQLYTQFDLVADTAGCLVVYPQGTKDINNNAFWNAGTVSGGPDDASFLNTLIDTLSATYNINPQRIYLTGLSNGGFMSQYMACFFNEKIAAIASVAGTMFNLWATSCNPTRAVPVMHIHGTADNVVPYNGNLYFYPAENTISFWETHNTCYSSPSTYNFPDSQPTDGCTAQLTEYSNCEGNSYTSLIKITGGGHSWPGGSVIIDVTNYDIHASAEIWKFFLRHTLNQTASATHLFKTKEQIYLFPNPVSSFLTILPFSTPLWYEIKDPWGQIITTGTCHQGEINLSFLPDGIYFITLKGNGVNEIQKIIKTH